ncbi:hypothetical protein QAD02_006139 [Eretmocerus hayati]|uniref:Uncharacterized protein n=1 Tax=Eretmocerus hayati TaxID=131215 RepID=A0ACC2N0F7_9HYME|nr:hypothetical protein QAD02_006139 [Eretmocerus hayati]
MIDDSDSGSDDEIVPVALRNAAREVELNAMPPKSRQLYTAAYNAFKKWRRSKGTNSFCEDVLLTYFSELSNHYAASSLWSTYSMLKSTILSYDHVDIGKYNRVLSFLKRKKREHTPKKSEVFTREQAHRFLTTAPDDEFLIVKVALILGVLGAMRREEFTELELRNVVDHGEYILVRVTKTKNHVPRSFLIEDPNLYRICKVYIEARIMVLENDRFFLRYSNGRCVNQAIGINTFGGMPRRIAEYLKLPNYMDFTGHSFRRTSATFLADAGADTLTLRRHGGWKSSSVAESYVADSISSKRKICHQITSGMSVEKSFRSDRAQNVYSAQAPSSFVPSDPAQSDFLHIDTSTIQLTKPINQQAPMNLFHEQPQQAHSMNTPRNIPATTTSTSYQKLKTPNQQQQSNLFDNNVPLGTSSALTNLPKTSLPSQAVCSSAATSVVSVSAPQIRSSQNLESQRPRKVPVIKSIQNNVVVCAPFGSKSMQAFQPKHSIESSPAELSMRIASALSFRKPVSSLYNSQEGVSKTNERPVPSTINSVLQEHQVIGNFQCCSAIEPIKSVSDISMSSCCTDSMEFQQSQQFAGSLMRNATPDRLVLPEVSKCSTVEDKLPSDQQASHSASTFEQCQRLPLQEINVNLGTKLSKAHAIDSAVHSTIGQVQSQVDNSDYCPTQETIYEVGKNVTVTEESIKITGSTDQDQRVISLKPKMPVSYHPDSGLCVDDDILKQKNNSFAFKDCIVSIVGSNNTIVLNNCTISEMRGEVKFPSD